VLAAAATGAGAVLIAIGADDTAPSPPDDEVVTVSVVDAAGVVE